MKYEFLQDPSFTELREDRKLNIIVRGAFWEGLN